MKARARTLARVVLLVAVVIVLVLGHGFILWYASSHLALSVAVTAGIMVLLVLKHLGLLGALFKTRGKEGKSDD